MIQRYGKYTFHCVYGEVDESLEKEIVAFWTRNRAINDQREACRRTREVVLVIRNAADEIAGITSVYVSQLDDGIQYYFFRIFIQSADGAFGMSAVRRPGPRRLRPCRSRRAAGDYHRHRKSQIDAKGMPNVLAG